MSDATLTVTAAELDALCAKLDALGDVLTPAEQTILHGIFRMAGQHLATGPDAGDVEGFAYGPAVAGGFDAAFRAGLATGVPSGAGPYTDQEEDEIRLRWALG